MVDKLRERLANQWDLQATLARQRGDTGEPKGIPPAYQFGLAFGFETAAVELRKLLRETATSDNGDGR